MRLEHRESMAWWDQRDPKVSGAILALTARRAPWAPKATLACLVLPVAKVLWAFKAPPDPRVLPAQKALPCSAKCEST